MADTHPYEPSPIPHMHVNTFPATSASASMLFPPTQNTAHTLANTESHILIHTHTHTLLPSMPPPSFFPSPSLLTLQQALEVELRLLVQLLDTVRPAPRAEHVHALLPWRLEVGRTAAAASSAADAAVVAVAVAAAAAATTTPATLRL